MVIDQFAAFLSASKTALDLFKGIRDELPKHVQSEAITTEINKAETALDTARAEAAKALGYRLCHCTFPPQVMLWDNQRKKNVCRCGNFFPPDARQAEEEEDPWLTARR